MSSTSNEIVERMGAANAFESPATANLWLAQGIREIERLQRELVHANEVIAHQGKSIWLSPTPEPPSGLPAPNVATLMSDLLDWASDAEDDETNNNGSSIVSAEGLRKLCYRAHAALSASAQPPPAECQRCHCMEKARAGGEIGVMNFTHWSKDPLVPYAGCICSSCEEARQQIVTTCSGSTKSAESP